MNYNPLNFQQKFALFTEQWQPKVIAEMSDYQFKVVRLRGDFIWHDHRETDETFIVMEGDLRIDFQDGAVPCLHGRDVCCSQGREAQALRGARSQGPSD